jgi:hypothetical protein
MSRKVYSRRLPGQYGRYVITSDLDTRPGYGGMRNYTIRRVESDGRLTSTGGDSLATLESAKHFARLMAADDRR